MFVCVLSKQQTACQCTAAAAGCWTHNLSFFYSSGLVTRSFVHSSTSSSVRPIVRRSRQPAMRTHKSHSRATESTSRKRRPQNPRQRRRRPAATSSTFAACGATVAPWLNLPFSPFAACVMTHELRATDHFDFSFAKLEGVACRPLLN